MAIIRNCMIFHAKLDPKRPNAKMDPENPSWELQIRTTDTKQRDDWRAQGLKPKLLIHGKGDMEGEPVLSEDGKKQWRVNLKKKSIAKGGEKAVAPEVVDGNLNPIDPNTIGNGSIGNVRVYQYESKREDNPGMVSILMGVQLSYHKIYAGSRESFDTCEYRTEAPASSEGAEDSSDDDEGESAKTTQSPSPKVNQAPADKRNDVDF